tara:strand:+ start:7445 stop:8677 length:1233 start_codon:yes stop_codon:yes gene_type:complete
MKNNYYESPKAGKLMRMFWKAAGADQYLLERSTYSDQIKYFCLGGIVLATGVMAGLAGGYAIYTIFEPRVDGPLNDEVHIPTMIMSFFFGIIWGLIIYNIDRFIVTSTGKGDGTEAITKQEIKSAIPRIIMGVIIALTISKPIEIRMFQKEIEAKLQTEMEGYIEVNRKLKQDKFDKNSLNDLNSKRKEILAMESDLKSNINAKKSELNVEETKCPPGSDVLCRGPQWYRLDKERAALEAQLPTVKVEMNKALREVDKEIKKVNILRDKELKDVELKAANMGGLAARIRVSHEVTGPWISLFITLLFMVIELTPIFFKMMLIKGPYDYMDENVKELARAEAGIEVQYDFYNDKEGTEAHKIVNHGARIKENERMLILAAQDEINKKIIETWKKNKMIDIEQNPDAYFEEK